METFGAIYLNHQNSFFVLICNLPTNEILSQWWKHIVKLNNVAIIIIIIMNTSSWYASEGFKGAYELSLWQNLVRQKKFCIVLYCKGLLQAFLEDSQASYLTQVSGSSLNPTYPGKNPRGARGKPGSARIFHNSPPPSMTVHCVQKFCTW